MPPVSTVMPVRMVKEGNASKHGKDFSENLA